MESVTPNTIFSIVDDVTPGKTKQNKGTSHARNGKWAMGPTHKARVS
jgi:hypothetical protein